MDSGHIEKESKNENNHSMVTRSKKNLEEKKEVKEVKEVKEEKKEDYKLELDEHGNVSDLIDYECNEPLDNEMLQNELNRLRGNKTKPTSSPSFTISPKQKKITKKRKKESDRLSELFVSYLIMNMVSDNYSNLKKKKRKKSNDFDNNLDVVLYDIEKDEVSDIDIKIEEREEEEKDKTENKVQLKEENKEIKRDEELSSEEDDDDDDSEFEFKDEEMYSSSEEEEEEDEDEDYDDYDEKFVELTENSINDEDEEYDYFHRLNKEEKIRHIENLEMIKSINKSNVPLRFKVLNSNMDIRTKSIAITNIEKLSEMDVSTGEYCKLDKWINGLIKIPFGENVNLPIDSDTSIVDTRKYLFNTQKILDKAIYGHKEAKMHILQVLGKWIKNPSSLGNVLALQGPMGNGKTTLVKEGIAKAINRPFAFIALGGASDSAFFDGHSYTYEGSHWGRIIDILIESKCMNPVIYFDELDKVSETHKGDEIIHLLTHLTDPSQNSLFQDNYFPGVQIDLSKVLFIFSFNDETRVNRILKDRMYVINTKGFKPEDKIAICNDYILPELLDTFRFKNDEIIFDNESLLYIIDKFTDKEEGVRNLKRCLETIISKINIYYLSQNSIDDNENIPLTFDIKNFKLPLNVTKEVVEELIKPKEDNYKPPEHMYM